MSGNSPNASVFRKLPVVTELRSGAPGLYHYRHTSLREFRASSASANSDCKTTGMPTLPAMVESRMGTVVSGQRPVSHPRSSNRTCRFPASGSPAGFTARHATGPLGAGLEAQNAEFSMNDIECESAIAAPLHLAPSHEEPAHTLGAQGSRVILARLPNVCPRHKCRHSSP